MVTKDRAQRHYDSAKAILKPFFIPWSRCLIVKGSENIITQGPNLIVANHPGIGRDVASVVLAYKRRLVFLAAHYLFDEEEFLQEHIRPALGEPLFHILYPIARKFAHFLARQLNELGMIPINRDYQHDRRQLVVNLRQALEAVKRSLKRNQAVVIFPIRYNLLNTISRRTITVREPSRYSTDLPRINSTIAKIVYELWQECRLAVPVTPIAISRGEGLNPLRKIVVNVGAPLSITEILRDGSQINPLIAFTDRLEKALASLLVQVAG